MEDKTLESLNSDLFALPQESMFNITGGKMMVPTRKESWTAHASHEDFDGYSGDYHA